MSLKDRWRKWKEEEEEEEEKQRSLMISETEEDIGILRSKLKIQKDGNDSLLIEHKEEIQVIFRKSMGLLISSILKTRITINH